VPPAACHVLLQNLGAYAGTFGGPENDESKVQWVADMDVDQPHPEVGSTAAQQQYRRWKAVLPVHTAGAAQIRR
jgi:hypothetical protein